MDITIALRARTLDDLLRQSKRLRISPGDLLCWARELTGNPKLPSLEVMHPIWLPGLLKFVEICGEPIRVPATVVTMRKAA